MDYVRIRNILQESKFLLELNEPDRHPCVESLNYWNKHMASIDEAINELNEHINKEIEINNILLKT
jgi:hypothetical protein